MGLNGVAFMAPYVPISTGYQGKQLFVDLVFNMFMVRVREDGEFIPVPSLKFGVCF